MTEELIEIRQLPVIAERLIEIKGQILSRAEELDAMDVTEETKKEAKKALAEFRKDFAALDDKRKAVKKAVYEPYEQFEAVFKECVTEPVKTAEAKLTAKIKAIEDAQIAEKTEALKAFFDESNKYDFLTFDKIGLKITLSASETSLKKEITDFLADVEKNINTINMMGDIRDGVMAFYVQTLDINASIMRENAQRQAAREAEKLKETPKKTEAEAFLDAVFAEETVFEDFKEDVILRFHVTPGEKKRLLQMISGFDYEEVAQ